MSDRQHRTPPPSGRAFWVGTKNKNSDPGERWESLSGVAVVRTGFLLYAGVGRRPLLQAQ